MWSYVDLSLLLKSRESHQNCSYSLSHISELAPNKKKMYSINPWYKECSGLSNKRLALFFSVQWIYWFSHLWHDSKRTGHVKIPRKFSNVLEINNSVMSIGFYFIFNIGIRLVLVRFYQYFIEKNSKLIPELFIL